MKQLLKTTLGYACGNPDQGRLGLGHLKGAVVPTIIDLDQPLIKVAAGACHSLFLTRDGTVYASGSNRYGQLGNPNEPRFSVSPREVLIPEPIKAISAGYSHSLCLGESGSIWSFGDNRRGQLGIGLAASSSSSSSCSFEPRLIKHLSSVQSIAAGSDHSLCSTSDGLVFAWGRGDANQLGLNRNSDEPLPQLVKTLQRIRSVYAGLAHSGCIDDGGRAHLFGQSMHAQINPISQSVTQLALGATSTAAISGDSLYIWGTDMTGSLGLGLFDVEGQVKQPQVIRGIRPRRVSLGWRHGACIDVHGHLYTWGWAGSEDHLGIGTGLHGDDEGHGPSTGQLGRGGHDNAFQPMKVGYANPLGGQEVIKWEALDVSCGFNHTLCILGRT